MKELQFMLRLGFYIGDFSDSGHFHNPFRCFPIALLAIRILTSFSIIAANTILFLFLAGLFSQLIRTQI